MADTEGTGLPEAAREALDAIAESDDDGLLHAQAVVEAARAASSPLHGYFTWDDDEAAEAYRLGQARQLIRSYRVRVIQGDRNEPSVRQYFAARNLGRDNLPAGTYVPNKDVTPRERESLLRSMRRDVRAAHTRFGHLAEYWELIGELLDDTPAE